jgi:predicted permease
MSVYLNGVAPNFFSTIEMPLLLGRAFTERDDATAPKVAIVNHAFVRAFLPGEGSPLGQRFVQERAEFEIVGVLRDAKYNDLRSAVVPTVYLPAAQNPGGQANFAVRGAGAPELLFPAIRAAVREIDPTIPLVNLRTQEQQLEANHAQERLFARFSGFFGGLALGLACVGLYGLMSYSVVRRTGEIGLRMALGALPGQVLRMILHESLALVCLGILLGIAGAWFASRLIASMLFGLSPTDPLTYALTACALVAVALLATLLPAQRAARVAPMTALRTE